MGTMLRVADRADDATHVPSTLDAFEAHRAVAEAAVQQCYRVSPGPGLRAGAVHVADMPAYHALAQRLFTRTPMCAT
jgi:hypothetical protein